MMEVQTHQHTPIIAITANAFAEDRCTCIAAGMDDYLAKPLEVEKLLATLQKWTFPVHSDITADIFNVNEFVARNQGDLKLSHDAAALFINNSPEYIAALRTALTACDTVALHQSAHKLKGAAGNFSLTLLLESARKIEAAAHVGDLEKAAELLPVLEQRFEQAITALRKLCTQTCEKDDQ